MVYIIRGYGRAAYVFLVTQSHHFSLCLMIFGVALPKDPSRPFALSEY